MSKVSTFLKNNQNILASNAVHHESRGLRTIDTLYNDLDIQNGLLVRMKIFDSKLHPVVQQEAPNTLREQWGIGKTLTLIN